MTTEETNHDCAASRSTAEFDGASTLTRWFDCGKDGRPVMAGWYQWEIFLVDDRGQYLVIETMAQYVPGLDFVVMNGRAIGITNEDQWRGLVTPNVEVRGDGRHYRPESSAQGATSTAGLEGNTEKGHSDGMATD